MVKMTLLRHLANQQCLELMQQEDHLMCPKILGLEDAVNLSLPDIQLTDYLVIMIHTIRFD